MSTETIFLPYLNAGEGLSLKLVSTKVDGREQRLDCDTAAGSIDLFSIGSEWRDVVLEFSIALDGSGPSVAEMVPPTERARPNVALLGSLHSSSTYRRWRATGSWEGDRAVGELKAEIRKSHVAGTVELRALLVRSTAQTLEDDLASEKGSRLAWSREWRIYVDPPEYRKAPGLRTTWEEFKNSSSRWRKEHPELLFHLDTTLEQPILFLNSGIDPDLQAVLKDEAPRGKKATTRDVLFAAIASSVWWSLLGEAERTLPSVGLPGAGWHRNVLQTVAEAVTPELAPEEALEKLTTDLRDPNGGGGVRERIGTAILGLTQLRGFAESLVRELA